MRSSDLPGGFRPAETEAAAGSPSLARRAGTHAQPSGPGRAFPPYLVLLRVGFTMPPSLPPERCALTAPFHPYPRPLGCGRYILCGTGRLAALKLQSRTLSGTLPCGVRTFLSRIRASECGSGRPARLLSLFYPQPAGSTVTATVICRAPTLPFAGISSFPSDSALPSTSVSVPVSVVCSITGS